MKRDWNQGVMGRWLRIFAIFVMLFFICETSATAETTIKYSNWQFLEPGRGEVLEEIIKAFEEETGIKLVLKSKEFQSHILLTTIL